MGGIADNGTIIPVGLPWILPGIRCAFGGNFIVRSSECGVKNSYDTITIDGTLTLMHAQGYRTDISTIEDNVPTKIHLQGYRVTIS